MMRLVRSREVAPIQVPVATAPSLDTPGAAYALRYRVSLWGRLRLAAFGVVLLPNLVPLLIVWGSGSLFSFVGGGISPQVPSPLGVVLAFLLTIYGVIGLFLLALAWLWRSYIVRANVQGLSGGLGRLSTFLPWDGIEHVAGRAQGGRIITYVVTGDAGRTQIAWRAQPTWFLRIAPEPGALPITPDEMAALVVRQSGKPLQIERAR